MSRAAALACCSLCVSLPFVCRSLFQKYHNTCKRTLTCKLCILPARAAARRCLSFPRLLLSYWRTRCARTASTRSTARPSGSRFARLHAQSGLARSSLRSHPLAEGRPLDPKGEPSPPGCRREAAAALWCLPRVARSAAFLTDQARRQLAVPLRRCSTIRGRRAGYPWWCSSSYAGVPSRCGACSAHASCT